MADFAGPLADITGATSNSRHKSHRHYGGPLARTPRAGDGRHVSAGLLACGSDASPPPSRRIPAVASGALLAAYSCGGSRGFEANSASHRVPFSPPRPVWAATRPSRADIEAGGDPVCQQKVPACTRFGAAADGYATLTRGRGAGTAIAPGTDVYSAGSAERPASPATGAEQGFIAHATDSPRCGHRRAGRGA